MRNNLIRAVAAFAALAVVAACSTGTASDSEGGLAGPGVDEDAKTITVSSISILSGPAATLGGPIDAGAKAYFDALNEAGGIDGWTIDYESKDSAYQAQKHVQLFDEVKGSSAIVISHGSPTTKAIQSIADRDGVPVAPASPDTAWGADANLFPIGTPYAFDTANVVDYLTDGGSKNVPIGVIYQNDELGEDGMRGFDAALAEYGIAEAGRETFKPGDNDFTAQIQALKSAGAEAVIIIGVPSATGPIVGTAASLDFSPQWALISAAFAEQLITSDGTTSGSPTPVAAALQDAIVTSFVAPWGDPSVPGMEDMLAAVEAHAPDQIPSLYFTYGYAIAEVVAKVLEKAIENGDLSRSGILEARQSVGEIDLGGLVPNVTYHSDAAPPSRETLIQKIDSSADGFRVTLEVGYEGSAAKALQVD